MPLMSQSAYARHRGIKRQSVHQAVKEGRIHLTDDGKVDSETADREWAASTHPWNGGKRTPANGHEAARGNGGAPAPPAVPADDPGPRKLIEARLERESFRARREQRAFLIESGELLDRADV